MTALIYPTKAPPRWEPRKLSREDPDKADLCPHVQGSTATSISILNLLRLRSLISIGILPGEGRQGLKTPIEGCYISRADMRNRDYILIRPGIGTPW